MQRIALTRSQKNAGVMSVGGGVRAARALLGYGAELLNHG